MQQSSPLWTKNFTILTLGTVISMLGHAISGFAVSLLVLDYTGSTMLFALFMVINNLPRIIMPSLAGPYLDRFSRVKVIYGLDFIASALYLLMFLILKFELFSYPLLLFFALVFGTTDSIYTVAYDSLYPMLITEGNYSKAYSISSMLYPISALMAPAAAYVYQAVGVEPLFLFNSIAFLIAAVFETQIKLVESQVKAAIKGALHGFRGYMADLRHGLNYLKSERGLLTITAYFMFTSLLGGATGALVLPYFKATPELGELTYTYVMGANVLGRLIGGIIHYRFRYPTAMKFLIAFCVYIATNLIDAVYLYTPVNAMLIFMFVNGLICVTSFNIRISSTQNYVPNEVRGRFNGTFAMLNSLGAIVGQLSAGMLGELLPIRGVVSGFAILCSIAAVVIMIPNREHVKKIYNVRI